MTTPGALAAVDQWSAAVAEVERFANGYLGLMEDERTESVVLQLLSGSWRATARLMGREMPAEMDGRLLVIWANGELQQLSPGWQLSDILRPDRVGRQGTCDRCARSETLPAAYVVPAPPSLIGLVVCGDCAIEMGTKTNVPWVVKK